MDQRESNRDERNYWHGVVRDFYQIQYRLNLDPAQTDSSLVPPLETVVTIQDAGKADPDIFFASGYRTTLAYQTELLDYDYSPAKMKNILEMGVGLGRLIIHYFPFSAQLYGCDVTSGVAAWTKAKLGHRLQVKSTGLEPPLPYPDDHFDFVTLIRFLRIFPATWWRVGRQNCSGSFGLAVC
jgi:Methyltransferase domain